MRVEEKRLCAGQKAEPVIQMPPARLDKAEMVASGLQEGAYGLFQPIRLRQKIGIENRDQVSGCLVKRFAEGPSLVFLAMGSGMQGDPDAFRLG